MKVRSGFVSNSSSSSFIIRGIAITEEQANEIAKKLGKNPEDFDSPEDMMDELLPYDGAVRAMPRRNYFDSDEETGFIIGKDMGDLEDGSFVEIHESTKEEDAKITEGLVKYGITGQLKTYVKMVSNDNY